MEQISFVMVTDPSDVVSGVYGSLSEPKRKISFYFVRYIREFQTAFISYP
jgi:hypothetical protein